EPGLAGRRRRPGDGAGFWPVLLPGGDLGLPHPAATGHRGGLDLRDRGLGMDHRRRDRGRRYRLVRAGDRLCHRLLPPRARGLRPLQALAVWARGPIAVKAPLFLCPAGFWIFITGMASLLRLAGVIVALMRVYAPVALLLLTVTALWSLPGVGEYRAADAILLAQGTAAADPAGSTGSMVLLVLGGLALVGLLSVDWGAASRWGQDVVLGGLTGLVLAASSAAILSLVIVAGAVGRLRAADHLGEAMGARPPLLSFRWAVWHG